jgi:hypothetical protein
MISTKKSEKEGSEFLNKSLQPGNTVIKITNLYLEEFPFGENAYNLILNAEGVELDNFEGFFINRDDESKGRYKSQVARIKSNQWAYADKELDNDVTIFRDDEIVKFLRTFCFATDCIDWLDEKHDIYETIEELVEALNKDCPFKDKWLTVCIAGREYQNKAGYNAYDLFFPKFTRNGIPFESIEIEHNDSRVYTYDQKEHIKRKVIKEVDSFEEKKDDFELD